MNTNNLGVHQNFYEIRYLLHGDRDRYDSQEILYIVSESEQSNLWVAIARTVIETWRILDSKIADTIPKGQWASLGIKELILSNILDRIQPTLINPRLLSAQEREELLRQVSSFNRQDIWRSLKLHETTTGSFTQINDHTYRVNPTFDLDPLLAEAVILVQNTQRPDWIPEWTQQTAINFIVRQSNPEQYAEILLKLLPQATDEQMRILRATSWLPLQSGGLVSPKNVVFFSDKRFQTIEERLEKILSVNRGSDFVTLSMLPADVRNALKAQRTLRDICDEWSDSHILSFLLDTAYFPDASSNCSLILDTLKILLDRNQTVSNDNFIKLQTTTWLLDIDDRPITPQQVINYPELNRELTEILAPREIRGICDYITPSLLQNDISICLNGAKLKDLFTSGEAALQQIGVVISLVDNYWIGDLVQDDLDVRDFLRIFDGFDKFPILTLAKKISEDQFRENILSQILKPISDFNLLKDVLNWIADNHVSDSNQSTKLFNKYLVLACRHLQFIEEILPNIKLLNSLGNWENPSNLCDGEKFTGIVPESILNLEHRGILSSYLNSRINSEIASGTPTINNSSHQNNAETLQEYFQPWLPYVSSELIGLFICLLTGSDEQTKRLAQTYLQRRDFEDLRNRLVFGTDVRSRHFVIQTVSESDQMVDVQNLLGVRISMMRTSSENLEHIFIGNLDRETTRISLREFPITSNNSSQLKDILFRSVRKFGDITGSSQRIEEIWEDISTSKQLDIEVTRKHILEDLRHTLDTLGVKNRNDELKQKLRRWEELRYQLTAEERQNLPLPALSSRQSRRQEGISRTIAEIENLVTNNSDVRYHILQSIRDKIGHGQYGYDVNSIPFELFQNADDALTELLGMTNNVLDDRKKTFVFEIGLQGLRIMHWGRPINVFNLPNAGVNNDFSDRGFDRDLLKMLSFNISDKSENVTGKFGLGFKSVYLICNEPKVISGDMSFSIESGLLPVALPRTNQAEQDYQLIKGYKQSLTEIVPNIDGLDGTLIDLPFDQSLNTNPQEITHEFKTSLGLLLAFSRSLKKCKFADQSQDRVVDINWNATNLFNSNRIAVGQIKLNNEQGWQTHNTLCFQLDDAAIAIVFPQNLSDKKSPLKDLPTFWVTAPTKEKLSLRFAINGKFDITTGRTSLDRNSPNNLATAQNIGKSLADALIHLFDSTQTTLAPLIEALEIENNVSAYDFWQFIWEVLAVDWLKKDLDESAKSILKAIFGKFEAENSGIGKLITRHRALPNGLSGNYQCLVSVPDVKYVLQGFISKQEHEGCFRLITSWSGFQSNCSPNKVVNASNWEIVRKLLGSSISNRSFRTVSFHKILSWEIGEEDVNSITPDQASRVGEVLTDELLRKIQISESGEYQEIRNILQTALFCNQNGEYINPSNILISDAREREEQLLAAFAPNDRLLNEDYIDSGKTFFLICRERRETISPEEMTGWAIRANTSEMQNAVLEYLNKGEKKQLFTEILKNSKNSIIGTWMENNQAIQAILTVNAYQLRVNEAIEGRRSWDQITIDSNDLAGYIPNNDDYEPDDIVLVNPDDLLRTISQWWQDNYSQEINNYNQRLYPIEFNDLRNRIREDDRSAWMMLFFLGFTHKMGRTKHEAHRNFIRFCLDNGWWDIFSRPYPQNFHSEWMSVLDQYIDPQVDRTQWNYWMEKFPSIYRIARYLDQYIHIFRTIDKHNLINLSQIIAPAINPAFQGSTLNAPPLNLSIGVNFVIRELVRLGVIQRTEQVIQHCFVPRYNVRRLLTYLGCSGLSRPEPTYSRLIASFLAEKINELQLNISPTFENAFDIPFELYSEDSRRVGHLPLDSLTIREDDDLSDEEN